VDCSTGRIRISARAARTRKRALIRRCVFVWLPALTLVLPAYVGALADTTTRKHAPTHEAKAEKGKHASPVASKPDAPAIPLPLARPVLADLPPDLATVKHALDLIGRDQFAEAAALQKSITDPAARKLLEWALLRQADGGVAFQRYNAFITANPGWPSIPVLRKRAEIILWRERTGAATSRGFFNGEPASAVGRLVLARLLKSQGDSAGAAREVRSVWRSAPLSSDIEATVLSEFPDVLTRADHLARMDKRIGAKDFGAAMRAARRVGDDHVAIVRACTAGAEKAANAGKLLDAVPSRARDDLGYALCRIHWALRNDSPGFNIRGRPLTTKEDVALAVKLALAAPQEALQQQDTDEWWRERRALARKLLDIGDAATAYQVVSTSALPANPHYRAEFHFMAGWIALRFLNDPNTATKHFALVDDGATDPRILARAAYWRGRAAEAAGQPAEMRAQYESASRYSTAYYGQLARDRLGLGDVVLRPLAEAADATGTEVFRAASILYAIDEHDLALSFVSDVAKESNDTSVIIALAKLSAQNHDAQATLAIGENALERGIAVDQYAFPDFGIPSYSATGPAIDRCIVYSVVRTESAFNQRDRSSASAVGLMQVTPQAGRDTAKRLGVSYDWRRLVTDPAYNTELGAGELAALLKDYRGSYILTFAGYNAGRSRVSQWMALHGDPRDPKIDAVDWVERIPFAETRNYVQRVMENLQVYRTRFGS
jgi:soluble lytic murein transglycosylase